MASYISDPKSNINSLQKSKFSMVPHSQNLMKTWTEGRLLKDGRKIGWVGIAEYNYPLEVHWLVNQDSPITIEHFKQRFGKIPLVLAAGSYVTSDKRTSGISAMGGRFFNSAIDTTMDGLVIIYKGRVSIQDISKGIQLPNRNSDLHIADFISDYLELVSWVQDEDVSIFQTHLLGFENDLAIDPSKASTTLRERRLLLSIEKNGVQGVSIVDLPQEPRPLSLSEAAATGLFALQQMGWSVQGIANLDVGSYNILYRATKNHGESLAPVSLDKAHNLLVIVE